MTDAPAQWLRFPWTELTRSPVPSALPVPETPFHRFRAAPFPLPDHGGMEKAAISTEPGTISYFFVTREGVLCPPGYQAVVEDGQWIGLVYEGCDRFPVQEHKPHGECRGECCTAAQ